MSNLRCPREVYLRLAAQRILHSGEPGVWCALDLNKNARNEGYYTPNRHAEVKG